MYKIPTTSLAVALSLLSCSVAAQAADLPPRTAPPVFTAPILINNWEGFYAGTTYGVGFTNFSTRQATSRSVSATGQNGGGLVGYNFQYGHWVFGPEGSIDLNVDRKTNSGNAVGLNPTRIDSLYDIRLRARLGYEFGWFMPFVAGGALINETYQSTVNPNDFGQNKQSLGYTIGAGVDVKINPSRFLPFNNSLTNNLLGPLILRLEYLHDEVPNSTFTFAGGTYRTHTDSNVVRAAIISRFGDSPPRPYIDASGDVNWGGAYGGIFGGGGSLTPHTKLVGGIAPKTHFDATGGLGGLYAGTNFMVYNRLMLGFEGSTSYTDISGNGPEPTGRASFRNNIMADIRGRVGYAVGNFLPFVAGGILYGRSEQIDLTTGSQRGRVNSEALTIGAGLDYRISERVSLRGEYLYVDSFNHKNVNLNGCNCQQDLTGNIFRVGAAYHFE